MGQGRAHYILVMFQITDRRLPLIQPALIVQQPYVI